jgi:ferredoxin
MCESDSVTDVVNHVIIPPHLVPAVVRLAGQAYLRDCPCRQVAQKCPPDSWKVCLLFDHASPADREDATPVTPAEALEVLQSPDTEGLVRQLFFTPAGHLIELCSCCTCCCSVLSSLKRTNGYRNELRSGWMAALDDDACIGCGECAAGCYFEARQIVDGRLVVNEERCFGCGRCVASCPQNAISLRLNSSNSITLPLDVNGLDEPAPPTCT